MNKGLKIFENFKINNKNLRYYDKLNVSFYMKNIHNIFCLMDIEHEIKNCRNNS